MSWPNFWTKNNWQTKLLLPLSRLVCREAVRRLEKFRQCQPDTPPKTLVIVVGNIVVGGTGKTPFIQWLTQLCQQKGYRVGIVSRGYRGKSKSHPQMVYAHSNPTIVGDEPVLLAKTCQTPVAVCAKRPLAMQLLLAEHALDIVISDDGLQHYALGRDIEVVLVDAQRQFGNELCLPSGPLREPKRRLNEVDFVVWNGLASTGFKPEFMMTLVPTGFRRVNAPEQFLSIADFMAKFAQFDIKAMAGIGNPQRFFAQLSSLGLRFESVALADHYAFSAKDFLVNEPSKSPKAFLMTQKDAVKCLEFAPDSAWYLEVSPECNAELGKALMDKIQRKLAEKQATQS